MTLEMLMRFFLEIQETKGILFRQNGLFGVLMENSKKLENLMKKQKKIDIGLIYRAEAILYMIKNDGSFYGIYPH